MIFPSKSPTLREAGLKYRKEVYFQSIQCKIFHTLYKYQEYSSLTLNTHLTFQSEERTFKMHLFFLPMGKISFLVNTICRSELRLPPNTYMGLVKDFNKVFKKDKENGPYSVKIEEKLSTLDTDYKHMALIQSIF